MDAGDLSAAERCYRQVLAQDARCVPALAGLGAVARRTGHWDAAIELFRQVADLAPGAQAQVELGRSLQAARRPDQALAAFQQALALAESVDARIGVSTSLHALGRLDEAVEALEKTADRYGRSADVLGSLAAFYRQQWRVEEALETCDRALLVDSTRHDVGSARLTLLRATGCAAPRLRQEHVAWANHFEIQSAGARLLANSPEPARPLRIGYVGVAFDDFLAPWLAPVLAAHDAARFQVFCYFDQVQRATPGAQWRATAGIDDYDVAEQVERDRIDILVDVSGHAAGTRIGVFSRRPAPVQMSWLDYLGTTGLAAIDYRVTDALCDPVGSEPFSRESLLRLPRVGRCWQPPVAPTAAPTTAPTRSGPMRFAVIAQDALSATTVRMLARMLRLAADAELVVAGVPEGLARQRLMAALACDPTRIEMLPPLSLADCRRLLESVDAMIDPSPTRGATLAAEALWIGIPVLTICGIAPHQRSVSALLELLGLHEWIAYDGAELAERAASLAAAPRQSRRDPLRRRLQESALMDASEVTSALEQVFRAAWQTWCADKGPPARNGNPALHAAVFEAGTRLERGMAAQAGQMLNAVLAARPDWEPAKQMLVRTAIALGRSSNERPAWEQAFPRAARRKVSAIVCSIRPDYFAHVGARLRTQFAAHDFELIGIHDARSLCEGYNRGAARATGEYLIFCHDDIDFEHADFGERTLAHLAEADLVGVAGTSRLVSGRWQDAGAPWLHGQIIHAFPGASPLSYSVAGLHAPGQDRIQALDGVFMATHRAVWERLKFDEAHFDGFHFYDIDFSYRAFQAGFRSLVGNDLLLRHFSTGAYDEKWHRFHQRFLAKFPALADAPLPQRHSRIDVGLQSIEHVARLHVGLRLLNFGAMSRAEGARCDGTDTLVA